MTTDGRPGDGTGNEDDRGATARPRSAMRCAVPVDGGALGVAEWDDGVDAPAPAVLAAHGVTATGAAWQLVADRLPGTRVIAPDLRGRGRSSELPGPATLVRHADDLARVLDATDIDRVVFLGHSLGAFVGVRFAQRHRDRLHALVLVDGGLPVVTSGMDAEPDPRRVLGPAFDRLTRSFETVDDYLDAWRAHPVIGPLWCGAVERALRDELQGDGPYRVAVDVDAVVQSLVEFEGGDGYREALIGLTVPTVFVRAGHGLTGGVPLYPHDTASSLLRFLRSVTVVDAPDESHYSLLYGPTGASITADAVREQVAVAARREAARAAHPASGRIRIVRPAPD